jgi:hypothetical protein
MLPSLEESFLDEQCDFAGAQRIVPRASSTPVNVINTPI